MSGPTYERLQLGEWVTPPPSPVDSAIVESQEAQRAAILEHFRAPLKHGSAGLIAAMRACPWGFDSAPDTTVPSFGEAPPKPNVPYDANERPACGKWKAGDAVLAPWFRRTSGLTMLYERTGGERAGELATAFLPEPRRRFARRGGLGGGLLDVLREHPGLADVDLDAGEGFKVLESREAWHYSDPKPGIEAITCRLCLRMILETQGARADHLAERAALLATRALEAELDAQREQALLERGTCPRCRGELARHDFEGLRVCRPCGLDWAKRASAKALLVGSLGGFWELLNATNRGTHAHT